MLGHETGPSIAAISRICRHPVRPDWPLRQQAVVACSGIVGINRTFTIERPKIAHLRSQHDAEYLILAEHKFIFVTLNSTSSVSEAQDLSPLESLAILLNASGLEDRAPHQRLCNWHLIAVVGQWLRTF